MSQSFFEKFYIIVKNIRHGIMNEWSILLTDNMWIRHCILINLGDIYGSEILTDSHSSVIVRFPVLFFSFFPFLFGFPFKGLPKTVCLCSFAVNLSLHLYLLDNMFRDILIVTPINFTGESTPVWFFTTARITLNSNGFLLRFCGGGCLILSSFVRLIIHINNLIVTLFLIIIHFY